MVMPRVAWLLKTGGSPASKVETVDEVKTMPGRNRSFTNLKVFWTGNCFNQSSFR